MPQQNVGFLSKLEQVDPDFSEALKAIRSGGITGALDAKTRSLISLAVHITLGKGDAAGGDRCRSLGATDDEIKEVIRVAFLLCGTTALVSGLKTLERGREE